MDMAASVDVPLTHLARSFSTRYFFAYPLSLLPFALQRFMQGRRLVYRPGNGRAAAKIRRLDARIVLWAFRWNLDQSEPWVPIWYRLPASDISETPVPMCGQCCGDLTLEGHPFFGLGQRLLDSIVPRNAVIDAPTLNQISLDRCPDDLKFLGVTESGKSAFVWRASLNDQRALENHRHKFDIAAVLEFQRLPGALAAVFAHALQEDSAACVSVLCGQSGPGVSNSCHLLVPAEVPGRFQQSSKISAASEGTQRRGEVESVLDRFLNACHLCNPRMGKEELLSILYVARCAEPEREEEGGHAHFRFSNLQSTLLKERIKKLLPNSEAATKTLVASSDKLRQAWGGEFKKMLAEGLQELGLIRVRSRWCCPDLTQVRKKLLRALRQSFPVKTVISNRIMGSGNCEDVYDVYRSLGGPKLVHGYKPSQLIAEVAVLPQDLQQHLLYVPLTVPAYLLGGTASNFFRTFGVIMAPPGIIPAETFREIAELTSDVLFSAHLLQNYRSLAMAATKANDCRGFLIDGRLEDSRGAFTALADLRRNAILGSVRLFDPWTHQTKIWDAKNFIEPWQTPWPQFHAEDSVSNLPIAKMARDLAEELRLSALAPWHERVTVLDSTIRNVMHGGLTDEIGSCLNLAHHLLESEQSFEDRSRTVRLLRAHLQDIKDRYQLLARRAMWQFKAEEHCDLGETCPRVIQILEQMVSRDDLLAEIYTALGKPCIEIAAGVAVREEPQAVVEVLLVLLNNILKWEARKGRYRGRWGISFRLVCPNQDQYLTAHLREAFHLWKPELREKEQAVLIEAYPFTGSPEDIQDGVNGLIQLKASSQRGLGTLMLGYITRVYCEKKDGRVLSAVDASTSLSEGQGAVLVLMPAA